MDICLKLAITQLIIRSVNMLAMFPKRRLAHHSIRVTGFEGKHFVTKKIIHVKTRTLKFR